MSEESDELEEAYRRESEAWGRVQTEIPKLAEQRRNLLEQIDAIQNEWAESYDNLKKSQRREETIYNS